VFVVAGWAIVTLMGLLPLTATANAEFGERAGARWVFDTTTSEARGEFARGCAKAVLVPIVAS
jgi:hypothetical protein